MKIVGIIPARLGSTRLPQKVLALIAGKPMIQHVWGQVIQAKKLDDVIVACDDEKIVKCVEAVGGKAMLTDPNHPNGSARVAEVAGKIQADVIINIQGDEPTMHPESIDRLADLFRKDSSVEVGTLAVRCEGRGDYENPNVVKVICNAKGDALYFSRSPLPYYRDLPSDQPKSFLKHLGIYGYQKPFLLKYIAWPVSKLESFEKLEQLRILEHGHSIRVVETPYDSWSVDTAQDLEFVASKVSQIRNPNLETLNKSK